MKTVGLITEYNPFHNGHLLHLNKIKEMYKDHVIVLVMSSTFMQRGEPSIIDKWEKTKIALSQGIDIVVELPFPFSTSAADIFAKGSVGLLHHLKVENLLFGSESGNINKLVDFVEKTNSEDFEKNVKKFLDEGNSYPKSYSLASEEIDLIKSPNDILGISYIKEIKRLKSNIKPETIKRTNDYHSTLLNSNIVSATSLRKALKENKNINDFVPEETLRHLNNLVFIEDFFPYLKYKIISESNTLNKYNLVDEGIENKILKYISEVNSVDELIHKIKSKRYTYSRLRRMFTHILCSYTKEENKRLLELKYIRVIGLSNLGAAYLKSIKKELKLPLISNIKNTNFEMIELEKRVTAIYELIAKNNLNIKEYRNNAKNIE